MNLILFYVMLFTFVSYVSFIWIKYGVQPSISESYYKLPKNFNFLFTLFCWGFALPFIIIGVPITSFAFFAGVGIFLVGAAAQFKNEWIGKYHSAAAVLGILFSQVAIIVGFHLVYLSIITSLAIIILRIVKIKNKTWWVEIVAFLSVIISLILTLYGGN